MPVERRWSVRKMIAYTKRPAVLPEGGRLQATAIVEKINMKKGGDFR